MPNKKRPQQQMSESFLTMIFLTLSGGFQDAYTYMIRDNVFANAQTGNIVLLATNLFERNVGIALRYAAPLLAFIIGVYAAELIRHHYHHRPRFHWRQVVVTGEIFLLFLVGYIPSSQNLPANIIVSFVCALQVQTFRKVNGHAYASTMCIGNMRSGTEYLYAFLHNKNSASLHRTFEYFIIVLLFALGAASGGLLTRFIGVRAIWCSCFLLAISLCLMFFSPESRYQKNTR